VDFDFASTNPEVNYGTFRWIHGLSFGVGFVF
jgi:hypothetical protein